MESVLAVLSSDRLVLSANPAYIANTGRVHDEVLGKDYLPWVDPRDREASARMFARAAQGCEPLGWVNRLTRPNGVVVLQRTTVLPLRIGADRTVVFVNSRPIANLHNQPGNRPFGRLDVAEYVEEMTASLARMATRAGFVDLGQSLEQVVGIAAEATARIAREENNKLLN